MMSKNPGSEYGFLALHFMAPFLIAVVFSFPSFADTDKADLSVGMKTLPLLRDKITGIATLSILFDPQSPDSKREADKIQAILDSGFEASDNLKLTAVLVPADDLAKMAGSRIAVLTGGLGAYYDSISAAVAGHGILTMSTDLACVKANKCILGIVSKPNVEIYYSRQAAENAKVTFGQVFALLVKEI